MTKIIAVVIIVSIILLIPLHSRLSTMLSARTVEEKLGYLPAKEFMKTASLEHKSVVSEWLFFKVLTYFGERVDPNKQELRKTIDYYNMYRFIDASTYIDPYNIDSYYFAQAAFTWEMGRIKEVNYLLERGIKYRTWDFYLPFFLGFNNFYFLKDYKQASKYMEQAARITGDPLFTNLAARLFYESNETAVAISFLKFMIEKTWNQQVKQTLETRLKALESVDMLEAGIKKFEEIYKRKPASIEEMFNSRIIIKIPEDPYGGKFFIDEKGKVRATSKFAFGVRDGNSNKDRKSE